VSVASKTADQIISVLEARFHGHVYGLETMEGEEREHAAMLAIAFGSVLCEVTDNPEAWGERIRFVISAVNAPKHRQKLDDM
jgi:hypothetical protein